MLNSIKLIYDDLKLYFLSKFNQENTFVKDQIIETRNDIRQIIVKEQDEISPKVIVPKPETKVIVEKVDNKTIFKSLREKYIDIDQVTISDGKGNEWSMKDLLTNPYLIITVIALIFVSGVLVISIYDVSLDTIKQLPLNLAKMTWAGVTFFILENY